jgi:arginase
MNLSLIGIPIFSGAYVSGTELAPEALRAAGLVSRLQEKEMYVTDHGNVKLPDYLPRHNIPPVRNWPAPRMVWDLLRTEAQGWFRGNEFTLLLGGDCSLVVGTAAGLKRVFPEQAYLLVIDGHLDTMKPSSSRCIGAAGMGLWFLLHGTEMWVEPSGWTPEQISVAGVQKMPDETYGIPITTLQQLRETGIAESADSLLRSIPADAKILVHFDVDVMHKEAMPAAYSPSETGLGMEEAEELLGRILSDERVVGLEVTEFSALRDTTGEQGARLASLLADCLKYRKVVSR